MTEADEPSANRVLPSPVSPRMLPRVLKLESVVLRMKVDYAAQHPPVAAAMRRGVLCPALNLAIVLPKAPWKVYCIPNVGLSTISNAIAGVPCLFVHIFVYLCLCVLSHELMNEQKGCPVFES